MARASKPLAAIPSADKGHPLIMTAPDLSHAAPGVRLIAEDGNFLAGVLIGLAVSAGMWAVIWSFL